jgi:hypothetical protein
VSFQSQQVFGTLPNNSLSLCLKIIPHFSCLVRGVGEKFSHSTKIESSVGVEWRKGLIELICHADNRHIENVLNGKGE